MDKAQITSFNLRVYGILLVQDRVLVAHENRFGMSMTKFPGGGLEKGEGLADALIREFLEETNCVVRVGELYYVNEFFQRSAFRENDQLISFYYRVESEESEINLKGNEEMVSFEWVKLVDLKSENFTFPIDQHVAELLKSSLDVS